MPYIDFQQLEELDKADALDINISWHSVGHSDVGRVRKLNEDAFLNSPEQGLWAVADGMGGLARGDYASGVVVDSLVYFGHSSNLAASIRDLEVRLRLAHDNCRSSFHGERVGSTIAALFSYRHFTFFLWAGDSRIYRLREGELKQMTIDHTVAQDKCRRGELNATQANRHPSAHILTRAVGVHQTLHLEIDYDTVQAGDRYLLCSDGLYNALPVGRIQEILGMESREESLTQLIDAALDERGDDNITAIVADANASKS